MPKILNTQGFTLVELMTVVSMVAVLSAIAIPSYNRFAAKARQAEAKIALGAIYTSEMAFFGEKGSYSSCLRQLGYVPESLKRYYLVGFSYNSTYLNNTCGPNEDHECAKYDFNSPLGSMASTCNSADPNHNSWPGPLTDSDIGYSSSAFVNNGYYYNKPTGWHMVSPGIPTAISAFSFKAGAAGSISNKPASTALKGQPDNVNSGAMADGWWIDNSKHLINEFPGI